MPGTFGPSAANPLNTLALEQADAAKAQLAKVRPIVNPNAPFAQQKTMLNQLGQKIDEAGNLVQEDANNVQEMIGEVGEAERMQAQAPLMASSYFNLMSFAQMDMGAPTMDIGSPMGDSMTSNPTDPTALADPSAQQNGGNLNFNSPEELKNWLDQNASNPEALNQLKALIPSDSEFEGETGLMGNTGQFVSDAVQRYQQPDTDEAQKMILAGQIFEKLNSKGEDSVQATYTEAAIKALIIEANAAIANLAKKAASEGMTKKAKAFNLVKQAQHRAATEFVLFGPESKRVLPGGKDGYLASDWHVRERNKAHDFNFDDNYFVDFDTFWRGNIMDKYSQPYRNNKGEWVGGYLNKRFETDRNVPEGNNLQLLPGQRRRPYLPEYRSTEARLADARKNMAEERGYDPTDSEDKAYNWKKASVKKK